MVFNANAYLNVFFLQIQFLRNKIKLKFIKIKSGREDIRLHFLET